MSTSHRVSLRSILIGLAALASAAPAAAQTAGVMPTAPAPVVAPGAGLSAPQADTAARPTPAAQDSHPHAGTFVPVLRAGTLLGGKGTIRDDCSATDGSCSGSSTSGDYEDKADFALAADGLYQASRKFRFGLGGLLVTSPAYKLPDGSTFRSGTESSFMGVVEGYFPTSPHFALTLRGSFGAMLLFPGADHQDSIDAMQHSCDGTAANCNVGLGPFVGPTGGIGLGMVIGFSDVRMRIDLQSQAYSLKFESFDASLGAEHTSLTETISGSRVWAMAGVEL